MALSILLLGATGHVGGLAASQFLQRGVKLKVIVRSASRLPEGVVGHDGLTVVEASLLDLSDEEMKDHVRGCDVVVMSLGHNLTLKGMFGEPRRLVLDAAKKVQKAIEALEPTTRVKFIMLNTVGVDNPDGSEENMRGFMENFTLNFLKFTLPPMADSVESAAYVSNEIGTTNRFIEWCTLRPDSFVEGDVSEYTLHEKLFISLFKPQPTTKANIAHFMCELATNENTWQKWRFKLPIIVDGKDTTTESKAE